MTSSFANLLEDSEPISGIRTISHERVILLVARAESSLFAMSTGLARRGFAICVESASDVAVEFLQGAPGSFHAIVTELEESTSASADFVARVRRADPHVGIVLWSDTQPVPPVRCVDVAVSSPSVAALADALTVLVDAP